jgi:hypothetical protein
VDQFISPIGPERVTLAEVYSHCVARAPTEGKAKIDLMVALPKLELSAGRVTTKFRSDGSKTVTENETVPADALADRQRMTYDLVRSSATWKRPLPDGYVLFEQITALRDQVLRLLPVPAGRDVKHPGGAPRTFDHDELWLEAFAYIYERGRLPKSLTALCEAVEQRLPPGGVPGDSQFREILKRLYQRLKQAKRK